MNIGKIAGWLLRNVVVPSVAKAVVSRENPLREQEAKSGLEEMLESEIRRQVVKRVVK